MSNSSGEYRINPISTVGLPPQRYPKRFTAFYYTKPIVLEMPNEVEDDNVVRIGKVLLTKIGQELAPICGSQAVEGFVEYVVEEWKTQSIALSNDSH